MNAAPKFASEARAWAQLLGFAVRAAVVLLVVGFSTDAHAYAWMVKHGYAKCSSCHTDPSGGETLSHMGRVHSHMLLSQPWGSAPELDNSAKLLHGVDEPNWLRLGGSLRFMNLLALPTDNAEMELSSFPMQMDVYGSADFGVLQAGGSLGLGKVKQGSPHQRAAQITSGTDYQALSRSHWLGVELGEHGLLRAGRLNLPFGIRIPEHVAWVRDATKTDRESDQQHGLAISYWGNAWRGEWMLVAGNYQISPDTFRERGYSGFFEYLLSERLAVGASSMILQSRSGPYFNPIGEKVLRHAHGVMTRYSPFTELSILAEADVLKTTGSGMGFTAFVQGDYEFFQGLHGMLTLEALDNGKSDAADAAAAPGAGEPIIGVWAGANWFFLPHFDVRLEAVYRQESATSIQSQIHYYF
jgi:hypothetical protein